MPIHTDGVLVSASHEAAEPRRSAFSKTLWIMRRDAHHIEATVAWLDGEWEIQLMDHASLITWRRFSLRPAAVAYADLFQQDLERDGWH